MGERKYTILKTSDHSFILFNCHHSAFGVMKVGLLFISPPQKEVVTVFNPYEDGESFLVKVPEMGDLKTFGFLVNTRLEVVEPEEEEED